jgi:hypothetical protein
VVLMQRHSVRSINLDRQDKGRHEYFLSTILLVDPSIPSSEGLNRWRLMFCVPNEIAPENCQTELPELPYLSRIQKDHH